MCSGSTAHLLKTLDATDVIWQGQSWSPSRSTRSAPVCMQGTTFALERTDALEKVLANQLPEAFSGPRSISAPTETWESALNWTPAHASSRPDRVATSS
ncbi:unnamed protein product [Dibothriocephalus latus]|uniref:Uncharacterized protein n=1 Tax=Dibothriocephalus latus TaxID=60516 RepID=A0A3P7LR76_DIBLA|nr:unnamed protein product [Dibothriocephalus latus]